MKIVRLLIITFALLSPSVKTIFAGPREDAEKARADARKRAEKAREDARKRAEKARDDAIQEARRKRQEAKERIKQQVRARIADLTRESKQLSARRDQAQRKLDVAQRRLDEENEKAYDPVGARDTAEIEELKLRLKKVELTLAQKEKVYEVDKKVLEELETKIGRGSAEAAEFLINHGKKGLWVKELMFETQLSKITKLPKGHVVIDVFGTDIKMEIPSFDIKKKIDEYVKPIADKVYPYVKDYVDKVK